MTPNQHKEEEFNFRRNLIIGNRKEFVSKKQEADKKYYGDKLNTLVKETFEVLNNNKDLDQNFVIEHANKEWKKICAKSRQINKYIKLNIDAYMNNINHIIMQAVIDQEKEKEILKVSQESLEENKDKLNVVDNTGTE